MSEILYEKVGQAAKIWLNRPEKRNMFNKAMLNQFADALQDAQKDQNIRVIVIQGVGKDFCAGFDHGDPEAIIAAEGEVIPFELRRIDTQNDVDYWFKLFDCNKPIICGIKGEVLGPGIWITMFADCVIAGKDTDMNNLELAAGLNYTDPFPIFFWKMPMNIAMEFALTSYPIDAERGQKCGLFNYVVEPEKVDEASMKLASRMLRMNPYTLEMHHEIGKFAHELKGMRHVMPLAKEACNAAVTITHNPASDAYWNNAKINGSASQPALFWKMIEDVKSGDDWTI